MIKQMLDFMNNGGIYSSKELAKEFKIPAKEIRKIVRQVRMKFLKGSKEVDQYIFTTRGGYTTDHKPEHVIYEARLRMAMGTGILINGVYVFKTGKKIAFKNFNQLKIEYKPRFLEIEKI